MISPSVRSPVTCRFPWNRGRLHLEVACGPKKRAMVTGQTRCHRVWPAARSRPAEEAACPGTSNCPRWHESPAGAVRGPATLSTSGGGAILCYQHEVGQAAVGRAGAGPKVTRWRTSGRKPRPAGLTVMVNNAWSTARCAPRVRPCQAAATSAAPIGGVSEETSVALASCSSMRHHGAAALGHVKSLAGCDQVGGASDATASRSPPSPPACSSVRPG